MKKFTAMLIAFCMMFAFASCASEKKPDKDKDKDTKPDKTVTETQVESVSKPDSSNAGLSAGMIDETTTAVQTTVPVTQTQPDSAVTEPEITAPPATEPSEPTETDIKELYVNYVESNPSRYAVNHNSTSSGEPVYTYIDLDSDGTLEMIYFRKFYEFNDAQVYFFDIKDGEIIEFTGSNYVASYRTADKYRVKEYNEKYYIVKTNNDGNFVHMSTVYSYNGNELIPLYTISGSYYSDSYSVSDKGIDAFDYSEEDDEYYEDISEEEFTAIESEIYNFGTQVFYSSELFTEQ